MSDVLGDLQSEKAAEYAPPIELRRFNSAGIEQWSVFLDSLGTGDPGPFPFPLLEDPAATSTVTPVVNLEQRSFRNRFEMAQYLGQHLDRPDYPGVQRDVGLWTWLSLFYFNQLCPPDADGRRRPGSRSGWILTNSGRSYFRHHLAGPFALYRLHKDQPRLVFPLLSEKVTEQGRVYRELTAHEELVANRTVLEVVRRLYFDAEAGGLMREAGDPDQPGNAIRLVEVLSQLQVTWDLQSVDADTLFLILPEEFDRFR